MTLRKRIVLALAAILVMATGAALAASWSWRSLNATLAIPEGGLFYEIRSGAALGTVTAELESLGVIRHAWLLNGYSRLDDSATRIHAGEYRLLPGLSAIDLLERFGRGDVYLHQFTIVEGWRTEELLGRVRAHPAIAGGTLSAAEVMDALGEPELHPEGQFLPDTYSFPRGTPDVELLAWAHTALTDFLAAAWRDRSENSALNTAYEGLILASIVEKETALERERGLIAGVFNERLKRRMRLQTDPTVIYGLGATFNGNLSRADLASDTPYNTYTRSGLPPTPIALAGRAAILAAVTPVDSGALYFVATGEPDGSHAFSGTLEEHNAAVSRYLTRQRAGE